MTLTRRDFLRKAGWLSAGVVLAKVPGILTRGPWTAQAVSLTPETVRRTFIALVEVVNAESMSAVADAVAPSYFEAAADWVIEELDRLLAPTPTPLSAVLAALLDTRTIEDTDRGAVSFSQATPDQRRDVLRNFVADDRPDMAEIGIGLVAVSSYAFWSDAALGEPAMPTEDGGKLLPQWRVAEWPGPSHSYLDSFSDGRPRGFGRPGAPPGRDR